MLPRTERGTTGSHVVFLHSFGTSRREWTAVTARLATRFRTCALDLPGFGEASEVAGYDVAAMADAVSAELPASCTLVGHSMSGKVVLALLARGDERIRRAVLVAPSPPGPEPIADDARQRMLGQQGSREGALGFVDANTNVRLPWAIRERAAEDVQRCAAAAWRAWLETGSREDWSARVGRIDRPVTLVVGRDDESLGERVQRTHTLPYLPRARVLRVPSSGHLVPLEQPAALAAILGRPAEPQPREVSP